MKVIRELINDGKIVVIGITGGVGSGKSTILDYVKTKYSALIYQADQIGHMVMLPETDAYHKIIHYFGEGILNDDATIDRKHLAEIVFKDDIKLEYLNSIIHPAVQEYIVNSILYEYESNHKKLFFIEAALLIESGYKNICNELWYIYASIDTRINRLINSRGYSKTKCLDIINNQLSDEDFRASCDFVINNENDFNITKNEIEKHMVFCYNNTID